MAEYLIQSETLTNMADKIRLLNGVEGAMTPAQMDGNLGEVNEDVVTEAGLIAQIASALQGKAGGSGLDTSDATATANNLEKGATAYVNGEKITGTIKTAYGGINACATSVSYIPMGPGSVVKLSAEVTEKTIVGPDSGGTVAVTALYSEFGDATAEDVAKGKTFTSAAGLKVEGTMEENSGESAETCTVTFDNESISSDCAMYAIIATVLEDGERKTYVNFTSDLVSGVNNLGMTFTIPNVVCGTKIYMIAYLYNYAENGAYVEITGSATHDSDRSIISSYDRVLFEFTAPSVTDEHCTIYYAYNS